MRVEALREDICGGILVWRDSMLWLWCSLFAPSAVALQVCFFFSELCALDEVWFRTRALKKRFVLVLHSCLSPAVWRGKHFNESQ